MNRNLEFEFRHIHALNELFGVWKIAYTLLVSLLILLRAQQNKRVCVHLPFAQMLPQASHTFFVSVDRGFTWWKNSNGTYTLYCIETRESSNVHLFRTYSFLQAFFCKRFQLETFYSWNFQDPHIRTDACMDSTDFSTTMKLAFSY